MIEHHFSAGVYAKEARIPAGHVLVQHKHKHDHLSILAMGSVELVMDEVKTVIHAPACLTIKAGKHHGIRTLSDAVWYCIHATECTDVSQIDEIQIEPAQLDKLKTVTDLLIQEN
jgi:mannose-6-phosphate isomerase-like protein (cupin superfamily)